jgi:hypothetical protein
LGIVALDPVFEQVGRDASKLIINPRLVKGARRARTAIRAIS